jgi:hypothetical protein
MTDMAVGEARLKGLRINTKAVSDRGVMYDTASFPPMALHERSDIMVPEIIAYTAASMFAAGHAPDRSTDAMALNIASEQSRDGAWHQQFGVQERPGAEDGDFARTALSIHALVSYGPPGRKAEMTSRVARARDWLTHASTVTSEDRNMQLLGLAWSGVDAASMKGYISGILATSSPTAAGSSTTDSERTRTPPANRCTRSRRAACRPPIRGTCRACSIS